jgi:hypothetical protein
MCSALPTTISTTATRSSVCHLPGVPAQRLRKLSENPTSTLIAVSEPLRNSGWMGALSDAFGSSLILRTRCFGRSVARIEAS